MTWRDDLEELADGYREDWTNDAACHDLDTDIFFPPKGSSPSAAKAICRVCPVRVECLAWALEINQSHGIAGGRTDGERRKMRRALRLPV